MITTDSLVRIASAGGSLKISTKGKTTDNLVRIASAVSSAGGQLIVSIASAVTTDSLVRIASAGNGRVMFEFPE